MGRRRGHTFRRGHKGYARVMIPSRRVRFGWHRDDHRTQVSLGFVIVTWWGFR